MKLEEKNLIVKRAYKSVYKCDDCIVKVFNEGHPKSDVFNEALNTARVEETGLDIPKVKEVTQIDGKWAIAIEYKAGKTLEDMMESDMKNLEKYMEDFVDLQLQVQSKKSPLLKGMKDKLARQINGLKDLDATTRYELLTRLESMPKHNKVCHGDFNPSNVIVGKNGKMTVVDWAHATQGNASADAAMTYLLFALKDQKVADLYLKLFCIFLCFFFQLLIFLCLYLCPRYDLISHCTDIPTGSTAFCPVRKHFIICICVFCDLNIVRILILIFCDLNLNLR